MNKLIEFNESAFALSMDQAESHLTELNQIYQLYKSTGLPELDRDCLCNFLEEPKKTIFKAIQDSTGLYNGLNHEKGFDVIVKPHGTDQVVQAVENFRINRPRWAPNLNLHCYTIEDDLIVVSEAFKNDLKTQCTSLTSSDRQTAALESLERLEKAIQEYNLFFNGSLLMIDLKDVFKKEGLEFKVVRTHVKKIVE